MVRLTQLPVALLALSLSHAALLPSEEVMDPVSAAYSSTSQRILEASRSNSGAWDKLQYLCDRVGHRLSGSESLTRAIRWAAEQMTLDGLENVRVQPVMVPTWVRGNERARLVAPLDRPMPMMGLGGSVATGPQGVRAPVVVVHSYDELEQLPGEKVENRIVVYNTPWEGYGRTVAYRGSGASRAAEKGAIAALVRSVTPRSLQSPHTGALRYREGIPRIPAAAITVEDAQLLDRLTQSGEEVVVELYMEARTLPDSESGNVIGELVGREIPEEVVVIGGHIDSWDVGQGAHDDGGGVVVAMEALKMLKELGLRPRRTIRAVLWTNEENGLRGGRAYAEMVKPAISGHVAAIEMDSGAERPVGFGLGLSGENLRAGEKIPVFEKAEAIVKLLHPIGASELSAGGGGADIGPLMALGVPGFGLRTVGTHYFDWHHTTADTVDKVAPEDLRACLAAVTLLAYVLADLPERFAPPAGVK